MPQTELDLFKPPEVPEDRSGAVFWVGKGHQTPRIKETANATEITRSWPARREDLARLFQRSEVFYCYDPLTALMDEARMCGCPVVLIPDGTFERSRYEQSELGMDGLAWGVADLPRAKQTIGNAHERYKAYTEAASKQLDRFIAETQALPVAAVKGQKDLRILAMPVDDGGCGYYRVRQPMRLLNSGEEGGIETHVVNTGVDSGEQVAQALAVSDIVLVRQGGEGGMRQIKQMPEFGHLKWVIDIDDQVELISPYSEHYREYGVEEFYDTNTKLWVWKDGVNGFDLARNRARVASFVQGLREADLVTVTTKALAEYAGQYNERVAVLPNCVDLAQWWPLDSKPHKTLRVGWSGGVSHYEDWYAIREPLNRLLRKHRFTLVTVGAGWPSLIDEDVRHLVEVRPWVPFPAHSYRMMCLGLDAAIIPLSDLPFNRYKSSIKWYEFAAMGVPAVVANTIPYSEDVTNGVTALAYNDPNDFELKLTRLLTDPKLRRTIGRNARQWVEEHRDARKCTKLWEEAYSSLTT